MASVASWAEVAATLNHTFGERLTLHREARRICWTFEGQSALVEMHDERSVAARFLDKPAPDSAADDWVRAVYVPHRECYSLDARGCTRMADDLVEFFRGTREPRFRFTGAQAA